MNDGSAEVQRQEWVRNTAYWTNIDTTGTPVIYRFVKTRTLSGWHYEELLHSPANQEMLGLKSRSKLTFERQITFSHFSVAGEIFRSSRSGIQPSCFNTDRNTNEPFPIPHTTFCIRSKVRQLNFRAGIWSIRNLFQQQLATDRRSMRKMHDTCAISRQVAIFKPVLAFHTLPDRKKASPIKR